LFEQRWKTQYLQWPRTASSFGRGKDFFAASVINVPEQRAGLHNGEKGWLILAVALH
jgi:hypothetical protein